MSSVKNWPLDKAVSIVSTVIFTGLFLYTLTWPKGLATHTVLTPYFLPRIYCGVNIFLSVLLWFFNSESENLAKGGKGVLKRFLIFSVIFIAYLIALPVIHFSAATAIFIAVVIWYTGTKPVQAVIYGIITSAACYLFFEKLFRVLLP